MKRTTAALLSAMFAFGLISLRSASAQPSAAEHKPAPVIQCPNPTTETVHTFALRNATQTSDVNEVYVALRQILPPDAKTVFTPSQGVIAVCAQPDQIALAQKLINDLDRPKHDYRLTYSVTEIEGTTRAGTHHYSMIVAPGQESTLKQGSRVPVPTSGNSFNYVDVGMNFTANIDVTASGIRLRTSVEQSSTAELKTGESPQSPVIRQASFKGTSYLVPGKPLKLGTFDIAGTDRHLELEVTMEPLP